MRLSKTKRPPTLRQDLKATRKSAVRTAFVVALLISGIVPAFSLLFASNEEPVGNSLMPLWTAFVHTYPLTASIAVITFSRQQKWFRWGKWFFAASVIIAGATISNSLGELTGHAAIEQASVAGQYKNPLFAIPAAGINYFIGFYQLYGPGPFLASLVVGIFAGKTASRFSRHVPRDVKSSAKKLVEELVENRNAA